MALRLKEIQDSHTLRTMTTESSGEQNHHFRFPAVFVSHGTPMHAFGEDSFQKMLTDLSGSLPKPRAVVVLSAHSVSTDEVVVLRSKTNTIQHDFNGFPDALYEIQYSAPGDPVLSLEVVGLLRAAGFPTQMDEDAPLDHGIWVPLMHLYPEGDVAIVRVSLPLNLTPAQILKMGHALSTLRERGVMILGSGGAVHNLSKLEWSNKNAAGKPWAQEFEAFLLRALEQKDVDALIAAEENPNFYLAHPTAEHYVPILFTVGSSLPGDQMTVLNRGIEYDSLSMLSFCLNAPTNVNPKSIGIPSGGHQNPLH
jgi:4,5-DOPA dioxygenase extradiol